jgi:hypothetical protein
MAARSPIEIKECIACHVRARPIIVRLLRGGEVLKGWHDMSDFCNDEDGCMLERGTKWLCAGCTAGKLQCGKCMTRFESIRQRCPACHPEDAMLSELSL